MVTTHCELCGKPTQMLGTKRCDGCWELESRIEAQPDLARKVLDRLETPPSQLADHYYRQWHEGHIGDAREAFRQLAAAISRR
jgi:hypothetical protein